MSTKKKKPPQKDPMAEYGRVVENAELESINLVKLDFDVKPQFYKHRNSNDDYALSYDVEAVKLQYSSELNQAIAVIGCSVTATEEEEETFLIKAQYIVGYTLKGELDPDAVKMFLNRVAVFACYPYFRSIVANIDWAAGTNLPPMPVHREGKSSSASNDEE